LTKSNNYGFCPANTEIRQKYNEILDTKGKEYIYSLLQEIDPETATKLHVNDSKRVIRALEIYEATGKTKSECERENKNKVSNTLLKPLIIGLNLSTRENLYARIDKRVDFMFEIGLEEEVRELIFNQRLTLDNQSMQGIGYKEFFDYFSGEIEFNELKSRICLNTRHYAKRQMTYFNKLNVAEWFYTDTQSEEDIINEICKLYYKN
jgi:tRNA dimethylallyltransferase